MKPTLLILAAGMGSRYGGLKQMDAFGPHGETIIDYSIHDAMECGYGKIVFIIRKNFEKEFVKLFEEKIKGRIATEYVTQELDYYMGNYKVPSGRTKPWGTAHAVLCARDAIREPFAVINADDFYGKDAFLKCLDFLNKEVSPQKQCIVGYELGNTISPYGSVSRGVCEVDERGNLVSVVERTKVYVENENIFYTENEQPVSVKFHTPVSMNFWGFDTTIFDVIDERFQAFLKENIENPKAEYFIPLFADNYIKSGMGTIKVIPTSAKWFGVTYQEDKPHVKESIRKLIADGVYATKLW
jgi:dTDP-glucose pyrophosphorylase